MQSGSRRMNEGPRVDLDRPCHLFLSSSSQKKFVRSNSMGAITGKVSAQSYLSPLASRPTQPVEDISDEVAIRMVYGGYQAPSIEKVHSGFRHNRVSSMVSTGSSTSLTRSSGDRLLDALNLSQNLSHHILGVLDCSWIAQAGDSGDRVVMHAKEDDNERLKAFLDRTRSGDNEMSSVPDDMLIMWNDFWSRTNLQPTTSTWGEEVIPPLTTGANLPSSEKNIVQDTNSFSLKEKLPEEKLPRSLDYVSYMIHLAVFAELGVFLRYLLQKLFGPGLLALTGDHSPIYLDLPANMVLLYLPFANVNLILDHITLTVLANALNQLGSFLMGWFGVVFKSDIRQASSDHIVVGLTTGCLGSLTTFSGWNQKMLELSFEHNWVFAIGGIILGMMLVNESIRIGVESAEALRKSLVRRYNQDSGNTSCGTSSLRVDSLVKHKAVMIIMLLILLALWGLSGTSIWLKFDKDDDVIIYLALLVGPPGAWMRWFMARLNGQGLGKRALLKWLPMGTLLANVFAACLMSTLSIISQEVNKKKWGIILSGIQFGFLGCLSTVSTFVAEVYAMRQSGNCGRAFAYAVTTILLSFGLGTLIYFDLI